MLYTDPGFRSGGFDFCSGHAGLSIVERAASAAKELEMEIQEAESRSQAPAPGSMCPGASGNGQRRCPTNGDGNEECC